MEQRVSKTPTVGDQGQTYLGVGVRVDKNSAAIEAIGTIDELNSWVGVLLSLSIPQDLKDMFIWIQHDLYDLGIQIRTTGTTLLSQAHVERLEASFERMRAGLRFRTDFVLPGGTTAASFIHVARSVCRRAERQLFSLLELDAISRNIDRPLQETFGLGYLNWLSDLLFVAACLANRAEGCSDTAWEREKSLSSIVSF